MHGSSAAEERAMRVNQGCVTLCVVVGVLLGLTAMAVERRARSRSGRLNADSGVALNLVRLKWSVEIRKKKVHALVAAARRSTGIFIARQARFVDNATTSWGPLTSGMSAGVCATLAREVFDGRARDCVHGDGRGRVVRCWGMGPGGGSGSTPVKVVQPCERAIVSGWLRGGAGAWWASRWRSSAKVERAGDWR
jgi:hypothetical protein